MGVPWSWSSVSATASAISRSRPENPNWPTPSSARGIALRLVPCYSCRMGREDGIATFLKHGREHMAAIGRKGYLVTCARWFGGDEAGMNRWLYKQASEREIERMVSAKLDARIAKGETCVCKVPRGLKPRGFPDDPSPRFRGGIQARVSSSGVLTCRLCRVSRRGCVVSILRSPRLVSWGSSPGVPDPWYWLTFYAGSLPVPATAYVRRLDRTGNGPVIKDRLFLSTFVGAASSTALERAWHPPRFIGEELPIVLEPEDDPFFDETPRQWAERVLTPKPAAARKR